MYKKTIKIKQKTIKTYNLVFCKKKKKLKFHYTSLDVSFPRNVITKNYLFTTYLIFSEILHIGYLHNTTFFHNNLKIQTIQSPDCGITHSNLLTFIKLK